MTFTRKQIRANRIKWCDWLETPGRKKAKNYLAPVGEGACCLGHGCKALKVKRQKSSGGHFWLYGAEHNIKTAPRELVDLVGLWGNAGPTRDERGIGSWGWGSLAAVNDETNATPAQIGAYLRTAIEGGRDTPFRPLSDYPEGSP